jgi:4-hydroxybenzoate polyprenyltransferase
LAISNARADLERDQAAGVASVATALGLERSWRLAPALVGAILAVAPQRNAPDLIQCEPKLRQPTKKYRM